MSLQMKLIIPLLDEKLTQEDLAPEAGFVDAYNYDANRPYLDDCVFLMYDDKVRTKESAKRALKFEKLDSIKNDIIIYKDGHPYQVYAFCVINSDAKRILKGLRHTSTDSYVQFIRFWGATDGMVNRYILVPEPFCYERHSVPEPDYHPSLDEIKRGEPLDWSPPFFVFHYNKISFKYDLRIFTSCFCFFWTFCLISS